MILLRHLLLTEKMNAQSVVYLKMDLISPHPYNLESKPLCPIYALNCLVGLDKTQVDN